MSDLADAAEVADVADVVERIVEPDNLVADAPGPFAAALREASERFDAAEAGVELGESPALEPDNDEAPHDGADEPEAVTYNEPEDDEANATTSLADALSAEFAQATESPERAMEWSAASLLASGAGADQVVEAARAEAAAILAEAEERKLAIIAETETRVALIEEEAIKAGVEAVDADRAKYKDSITEIVNQSLADARALVANGEEQAQELLAKAEEEANDIRNQALADAEERMAEREAELGALRAEVEAIKTEAEEARVEAEAMRAKAEDALQVAEAEAEEKRQHAAEMLNAIEQLKVQLQARAAELGVPVSNSDAVASPASEATASEPADPESASEPTPEPEPVAVHHDVPVVRPSSQAPASVTF